MTPKQAQARLDRADRALRMAGVSNLGMSAIYQRPEKQIHKLYDALYRYVEALDGLEQAKKGKAR